MGDLLPRRLRSKRVDETLRVLLEDNVWDLEEKELPLITTGGVLGGPGSLRSRRLSQDRVPPFLGPKTILTLLPSPFPFAPARFLPQSGTGLREPMTLPPRHLPPLLTQRALLST